ncbi:MAG: sugar phosphate isomerase/epimerase [bacterium]
MHPEKVHPDLGFPLRHRLGLQVLFDFDDIADALRFAAGNGFGALELNMGNLDFCRQLADGRRRRQVRMLARQLGIRLAVHAIEGPSLFVPDRTVMRTTVRSIRRLLDEAESAGIENVVMHLGFEMYYACEGRGRYPHERYPDFYEALVGDALSGLREYARGRARLCIENVGGFRFDFVHRLLSRLLSADLGLCYDVGHNAILPATPRRAEATFYRRHARRVYHSHLHDNHGERDEHLALGQGGVRFGPYLRFLAGTPALLCLEVRPRAAAVLSRDYLVREVLARL